MGIQSGAGRLCDGEKSRVVQKLLGEIGEGRARSIAESGKGEDAFLPSLSAPC